MQSDKKTIKTLLFSTLYPSSVRPNHGIFVETRLRELLRSGQVVTKVVAPVPWFFSTNPVFGDYAKVASTPKKERLNGIEVVHPRYFLPPKVGMHVAPLFLAISAILSIKKLIRDGYEFDLIDAHYYYPDGVAAAIVAKFFGKSLVVTARGTDINLIPRYAFPRKLILWASNIASASISVCRALRNELETIGAHPSKLVVLRNGVDLERFRPVPQQEARQTLGWPDLPTLISVGYLVERKGHHIAIETLAHLPGYRLVIVGSGEDRELLERLASKLGVSDRVIFAGTVPQTVLRTYYSAADVLLLCSSREGWANVLLEAMASGTPVVASNIWGTPEVVGNSLVGRLAGQRTAESFVSAICDLMSNYPDRAEMRRYAETFSWDDTTRGQLELFRKILTRVN